MIISITYPSTCIHSMCLYLFLYLYPCSYIGYHWNSYMLVFLIRWRFSLCPYNIIFEFGLIRVCHLFQTLMNAIPTHVSMVLYVLMESTATHATVNPDGLVSTVKQVRSLNIARICFNPEFLQWCRLCFLCENQTTKFAENKRYQQASNHASDH